MKAAAQTGVLWRVATTRMPTKWGMFRATGYEREFANGNARVETALAIGMGDLMQGTSLLRIHSQCFTGEALGSLRCDCGEQLSMAMQAIAEEGRGSRHLRVSGGPRHRLDGEAACLRAAGCRRRHRRSEPCHRVQGRLQGFQPAGCDPARPRRQPGSPS